VPTGNIRLAVGRRLMAWRTSFVLVLKGGYECEDCDPQWGSDGGQLSPQQSTAWHSVRVAPAARRAFRPRAVRTD